MHSLNDLNVPDQKQLHGLDHLRALAILLVFFFHYQLSLFGHPDWVPLVSKFGWTGVDLFFVLSGFLISSQLFAQLKKGAPIRWKIYGLKRFVRIVPAYLVVLGIYFSVPSFREKEALPPLWKFLTFTQNLGLNLRETGTFSHAWSLCVEAHFYLFLPLFISIILLTKSVWKSYWLVAILVIAGLFIRSYSWTTFYLPAKETPNAFVAWYKYVYYPTYNRLDGLLAGVTVAGIAHFLPAVWNKLAGYGNWLTICGLLVLTCAYLLCEDEQSYYASVAGYPVIAVGYGLLAAGAVLPASFLSSRTSPLTAFVARISYSIYLTHKGVIHVTQSILNQFDVDVNSNLTLLCCLGTCILAATLLYLLVEQPFMNWLKKRTARKRVYQPA